MAHVLKDRVKETTTTTGTGTLSLSGAVAGYRSFSEIGNANTTYYCIEDKANFAWEVGIGTYTASGSTLSRTTVLASSNANALVNFAAGSKEVFCTYPADKSVYEDDNNNAVFDSGYGSSAPAAGCRAWVNFNGTGTVAIRGSFNVSSITDNGTGNYTVNFTNSMPDANYSVSGLVTTTSGLFTASIKIYQQSALGVSGFQFRTAEYNNTLRDSDSVHLQIFR